MLIKIADGSVAGKKRNKYAAELAKIKELSALDVRVQNSCGTEGT